MSNSTLQVRVGLPGLLIYNRSPRHRQTTQFDLREDPYFCLVDAVNTAFYAVGADQPVISYFEWTYAVGADQPVISYFERTFIQKFLQRRRLTSWDSLLDVVLEDDALRVLIEDLKLLLTEELWKQVRKDCAVRSQILNVLIEAIIILTKVALEHNSNPSAPSPYENILWGHPRFRKQWRKFYDDNKRGIHISREFRTFLSRPGIDRKLAPSDEKMLKTSPFAHLMDYWEGQCNEQSAIDIMLQAVKIEQERRDSLRAPDIQFPDMLPPLEWTHLHGFWSTHCSKNPVWRNYDPFLTFKAIPKNVRTDDAHWLHRYLPDQRYVLERSQNGNFVFLKPDSVFYPRRASPRIGSPSCTGNSPRTTTQSPRSHTQTTTSISQNTGDDGVSPVQGSNEQTNVATDSANGNSNSPIPTQRAIRNSPLPTQPAIHNSPMIHSPRVGLLTTPPPMHNSPTPDVTHSATQAPRPPSHSRGIYAPANTQTQQHNVRFAPITDSNDSPSNDRNTHSTMGNGPVPTGGTPPIQNPPSVHWSQGGSRTAPTGWGIPGNTTQAPVSSSGPSSPRKRRTAPRVMAMV